MAIEREFLNEAKKKMEIEQYISNKFSKSGYSHVEIQRTPLAMRITIWAHKPGIIIGRGGKNIEEITEALKTKFGIENPQLDIEEVEFPYLDAAIVAKEIAGSIEHGLNYKRVVNTMLDRVLDAGAIGIGIRVAGKVGGEMSRIEKFSKGYLKYAGDPSITKVKRAYATASMKLGRIGIQVRILREPLPDMQVLDKVRAASETPKQETGVESSGVDKKEGNEGDGSAESQEKA
ncbi:MAG TPA: 30S ribosomal protein S3 [archaeon]|nr:30S ribosomal protein S3 [archaeon]